MSKAIISVLMALVLLFGMISTMLMPTITAQTDVTVGSGDYNNDGKADLIDAMMLMRYINGSMVLTTTQKGAMDVVADGKVDVYDMARLYAVATGRVTLVGDVADVRSSTYATVTAQTLTTSKVIAAGETVEIALTAKGLQDVLAMEMHLNYDAKQLRFVSGSAVVSGFSFNFNSAPVSSSSSAGELWVMAMSSALQSATIPDDETLAVLRFEAITDITSDVSLSFTMCNAVSDLAMNQFYTERSIGVDGGIAFVEPDEPEEPQAYMTYTIETVDVIDMVDKGNTVELNVLMNAVPDVNGMQLYLTYDDTKWEWVSGAFGSDMSAFSYKKITTKPNQPITDKGEVWLTAMSTKKCAVQEGAVLATVTLRALCDITEDETIGACYAKVSTYEGTLSGATQIATWVDGGVKIVDAPLDPSVFTVVSTEDELFTDEVFAVDIQMDGDTGLSSFDLAVLFDSRVLTPVVTENGVWATWNTEVLGGGSSDYSFNAIYDVNSPDELVLSYASTAGNSLSSGVIATVYFRLNTACLIDDVMFATADVSVFTDNATCKTRAGKDRLVPTDFVSDTVTAYHALTLEYYDIDGNLLESIIMADKGAQTVIPEPSETPAKWNYSFLGWNTVSANHKVTKKAMFGYVVEVENGTIDGNFVNGQWIEEGTKAYFTEANRNNILGYDSYVEIHANTPSDGSVFAYWKDQYGNVVSYEETYKFFVPGNLKLTAVYATDKPDQKPSDAMQIVRGVYDPTDGGSITWVCALNRGDLEKYTVLECGVIYGPGNVASEQIVYATLCAEAAGRSKRVPVNMVSKESAQYSVTITGVTSGRTRAAIAYAVYKDSETGEEFTVYSKNLLTLQMNDNL